MEPEFIGSWSLMSIVNGRCSSLARVSLFLVRLMAKIERSEAPTPCAA